MENNENNIQTKKVLNTNNIIFILVFVVIILTGVAIYLVKNNNTKPKTNKIETNNNVNYLSYRIEGNNLGNFDLLFLQLENNKKNMLYSPMSIKKALEMLEEGTNGQSKEQISNIIGTYTENKYANNKNMSFANALFVKDTYKDSIKESYVETLKNKYNAEIITDTFKTPKLLNDWVSNKTFKLINNLFDDVSDKDFILVNALAIDMEWINQIRDEIKTYQVEYLHETNSQILFGLTATGGYDAVKFNGKINAKAVEINATANKYDIIAELGENKIKETVQKAYDKWKKNPNHSECDDERDKLNLNKYIKELKQNYKKIGSSTDFLFYDDENTKVFAKDLKTYNGITLQYVGILPKKDTLENYIKNINAKDINDIINNLKPIELNSFKDGVVTVIEGKIPMFKFDYELDLMKDLNTLDIKDVFDATKADLSNLTTTPNAFIDEASHKATIEFSNYGIKAAAATDVGGLGAGDCGFDYLFEPPTEKIDLTFNNPFMFIIRNKDTGEIWFAGTVYEPIENKDREAIEEDEDAEPYYEPYLGDINLDEEVNGKDQLLLAQYLEKKVTLNEKQLENADINRDDKVNEIDNQILLRYLAGLKSFQHFPYGGYYSGDLNQDYVVNGKDQLLLAQYLEKKVTLNEEQQFNADLNLDGKINEIDNQILLRNLAGWDTFGTLPYLTKIKFGDINADGEVNLKDSVLLNQYLAKTITLNETEQFSADVNLDGKVDETDKNILENHLSGNEAYKVLPYLVK